MNDLHQALGDIGSIRRQVARSSEFHGYGPATLSATALLAALAGVLQSRFVHQPAQQVALYLILWGGTAVASAGLIAIEMFSRTKRIHSGLADEMIRMAVVQFLPAAVAGAALVAILVRFAPAQLWMAPGLLQVVFSLGVFASCRALPRPMAAVGVWYLLTGLACIAVGSSRALSPWAMAVPFCVGQLAVAAIMFVNARRHQ